MTMHIKVPLSFMWRFLLATASSQCSTKECFILQINNITLTHDIVLRVESINLVRLALYMYRCTHTKTYDYQPYCKCLVQYIQENQLHNNNHYSACTLLFISYTYIFVLVIIVFTKLHVAYITLYSPVSWNLIIWCSSTSNFFTYS